MIPRLTCWWLLLFAVPGLTETTQYQTPPKHSDPGPAQSYTAPLISINPDTDKTRVWLAPQGALRDALNPGNAPTYHAWADYQPSARGIAASLSILHHHLAQTCPAGWIKQREWVTLKTEPPRLHFQFQCLESSEQ